MFHLLLAIIYLSFISLGLPDGMLGAAWPTMYPEFDVPVSYAGLLAMFISAQTVISSLLSDRLTKKFGAGKVTAVSVAMTMIALFGFSVSTSMWHLFLWAIPYGLGGGSVDASLNNYVALHYESRHMSWLHCMWGLGAMLGPYIMSFALTKGQGWNMGYRYVGIIQIVLTMILICSLPLWKKPQDAINGAAEVATDKPLTLKEIISLPGAKEIMIVFFGYCALEQTAGLWASSYMVLQRGISAEIAAKYASLFYLGITIGRAASGFITMKLQDRSMIRLGLVIISFGILVLLIPMSIDVMSLIGLILVGLGCAPIYPCVIHSTPDYFGADKSQAVIGVQMASAYVGSCVAPPVFGWIANHVSIGWYPVYLAVALVLMFVLHEKLCRLKKI
ncbi:MAG: MFS transporter [Lachnospiraceae bacterium]|nr:MFS transporter [Lachnospiraceae bacterium]